MAKIRFKKGRVLLLSLMSKIDCNFKNEQSMFIIGRTIKTKIFVGFTLSEFQQKMVPFLETDKTKLF
jgi:hypothetical protein